LQDIPFVVPAPVPASPLEVPFARVNAVAKESPAQAAGLLEDDLIFKFDDINLENHNHLKAISALVPDVAGEGGCISISVKRRKPDSAPDDWETFVLSLTPKPWSGRGLIGCHLVPYTS
jgi:26S proteasome non-ATPase regulatory subunit 9